MTAQLKIVYKKTEDLIPYARNSRTHDEGQVAQIAASIKEFGFTNPILLDGQNGIIAGHGRVLAARKLAMTTAPCLRLTNLTETQRRAYVIADNKLALNAEWDEAMLDNELAALREAGFDLNFAGFDGDEIERILNPPEKDAPKDVDIIDTFEVIAECNDENEQRIAFEILNEKGIKCRLSTL